MDKPETAKTDKPTIKKKKRRLKVLFNIMLIGIVLVACLTVFCNVWIIRSTKQRVHRDISAVPYNDAAVVMGASSRTASGRENRHFKSRIEAAAKLYHAGKVKHIVVSGDNHIEGYDEPTDMKNALIELGVPAESITCDYAGFRTLDTVVRAKEVFCLSKFTIVSQEYHNTRAVFIAERMGIDAQAFCAEDVVLKHSIKTEVREVLARVKAVLDLYILKKKPKFLGPKEPIFP